jgi:hypothetical protein
MTGFAKTELPSAGREAEFGAETERWGWTGGNVRRPEPGVAVHPGDADGQCRLRYASLGRNSATHAQLG